jgi:hypothetical protein
MNTVCQVLAGPSGASVRTVDSVETGIPIILPKSIRAGRVVGHRVGHVAAEAANKLARYRLSAGDILCTRTGELGVCALTTGEQEGWLFSTGLLRLRPGNLVRARYLKYYLALPATRDWIDRHTTGTAVPTISTRAFGALPVVLPPVNAQAAMAEALGTLDEQVEVHERISATAARLRDMLAPLLLTGAVATDRITGA